MLSLIGSVLGFGTSFLPKILGFFEEKRDQAHELSMMDKQLEQQLQIGQQKLSAGVRPVITYCLFAEFAILTFSVNMGWIDMPQYKMIWNSEFQAIFAAVVSFWFGSRSFNRK